MNFESLKANFFKKLGINNNNENLFKYASQFEEYAISQGYDTSIFAKNLSELSLDNGKISNSDTFSSTINDMLGDSNLISMFDTSGNSKLSSSEVKEMMKLMSGFDGSSDDLSMDDFAKLYEMLNSGKLSELNNKNKIEEDNKKDKEKVNQPNSTGGTTSSGGASGAGGSSSTGSGSTSTPAAGATQAFEGVQSGTAKSDETSNEIQELNKKIEEQRKEKAEQLKEKAEAKKDDVEYNKMLTDLQTVTANLSTAEANVTTYQQEVHDKETSISAKKSELEALKAQGEPEVFDEYKADYAAKIAELEGEISDLENEKNEKQAQLDAEKQKVTDLKTQESQLNQQIQQYEQENPDEKIDECNDKIKECDDEIKDLEKQKKEKEEEIKKEREQEKGDADVYGKAQAYRQNEFVKFMMDYATDPATKQKYDEIYKKYYQSQNGAYCAVFTSEVTEVLYAAVMDKLGLSKSDLQSMMSGLGDTNGNGQSVTGTQMSMESYSWGQKIQAALNQVGINTTASIDITKMTEEEKRNAVREGKIYPGMTFEYKRENGGYHTGFIESINPDLSWNTIEGNTTIKLTNGSTQQHTVGSHASDALSSPITTATNSISKVLVWLVQSGKMTKEEVNQKYLYNV